MALPYPIDGPDGQFSAARALTTAHRQRRNVLGTGVLHHWRVAGCRESFRAKEESRCSFSWVVRSSSHRRRGRRRVSRGTRRRDRFGSPSEPLRTAHESPSRSNVRPRQDADGYAGSSRNTAAANTWAYCSETCAAAQPVSISLSGAASGGFGGVSDTKVTHPAGLGAGASLITGKACSERRTGRLRPLSPRRGVRRSLGQRRHAGPADDVRPAGLQGARLGDYWKVRGTGEGSLGLLPSGPDPVRNLTAPRASAL